MSQSNLIEKHMKRILVGLLAGLFCLNLLSATAADAQARPRGRRGQVVHVVSFKFKEDASKEAIAKVEKDFAGLREKISEIATLEWGTNISPEKLNKGFTHCFVLTFRTEPDRDAYLIHPNHKKFAESVGPVVADVFVIDYLAQRQ